MVRPDRTGSLLALVLFALAVAGVIALALADRAVRGARTVGWSREHAALRLLAESAAEELFRSAAHAANDPARPEHAALRGAGGGDLGALAYPASQRIADELGRAAGAKVILAVTARVVRRVRISRDAAECAARVAFDVTARLARPHAPLTERVRSERAVHVARGGLPAALAAHALLVCATRRDEIARIAPGRPASARRQGAAVPLLDLLTAPPPVGLAGLDAADEPAVRDALDALVPDALLMRAHFLTTSAVELSAYLDARRRAGARVDGVLHNGSSEPLLIEFPQGFAGRCTISTMGPVEVGEVRLADPARDGLTIVSAAGIVVAGGRVEADLVAVASPGATVTFARTAEVLGSVVTRRFPRGRRIAGPALGACRVGGRGGAAAAHHAVLSPHPVAVQYRRDRGEPTPW